MSRAARRGMFLLLVAGLCVWIDPACAAKKSSAPITSKMKGLEMSPEELRLRVRALIRPTLGTVEQAADRIRAESSDPVARRGALRWKIETTTTLLSALLRPDPILALADAWGYTLQVQAYLKRPEWNILYGQPASATAAEAMKEIETDLRQLTASLGVNTETFEARIRQWAEAYPIVGALYRRPSMDSEVAKMLTADGGGGAFAALGNLQETTTDIVTRMDLYTMYLPRLARWEAELGIDDVAGDIDSKSLAADLERFAQAADKLAAAAEGAPELVERERAAAFESVRAERLAATKDLEEERKIVLDAIHQERIATLQEVEAMAQRLLDRSASPLRESVRADLEDLVRSVEEMRKRLMVDAGTTLDEVVDHAFVRAIELLLIAAALGAVGVFLYPRLVRR